jgi:hypothetical protein
MDFTPSQQRAIGCDLANLQLKSEVPKYLRFELVNEVQQRRAGVAGIAIRAGRPFTIEPAHMGKGTTMGLGAMRITDI